MTDFQTLGPLCVKIELACVGDVRITAADTTTTTVDVRPRDADRSADVRAAGQVTLEHADGVLRVVAHRSWRATSLWGNGGAVDIALVVPSSTDLSVDLAFGRFDAEGRLGACRIKTAMGNVRLGDTATAQITTGYGDVLAGTIDGPAEVSTGSGSLRIDHIGADAWVRNSNGDTTLGDVAGTLAVKAANGDIVIGRARGSVTAKTANGSVRVAEIECGSATLSTACGDIEVGIRAGTAAWLDASSKCGAVRSSLETADAPAESEQTAEVRARTSYGDISIRRAPH